MALQATIEPRKRKKVVLLSKRQLQYIIERVKTLDVSIMRAVVVKLVDEREAVQFSYYPARQELWHSWKSTSKLDTLLNYLLDVFVEQFGLHTTGPERFARFMVAWYNVVGSIACPSLENPSSSKLWKELKTEPTVIRDEDRSATVFGVANCFYTFVQQQVSMPVMVL